MRSALLVLVLLVPNAVAGADVEPSVAPVGHEHAREAARVPATASPPSVADAATITYRTASCATTVPLAQPAVCGGVLFQAAVVPTMEPVGAVTIVVSMRVVGATNGPVSVAFMGHDLELDPAWGAPWADRSPNPRVLLRPSYTVDRMLSAADTAQRDPWAGVAEARAHADWVVSPVASEGGSVLLRVTVSGAVDVLGSSGCSTGGAVALVQPGYRTRVRGLGYGLGGAGRDGDAAWLTGTLQPEIGYGGTLRLDVRHEACSREGGSTHHAVRANLPPSLKDLTELRVGSTVGAVTHVPELVHVAWWDRGDAGGVRATDVRLEVPGAAAERVGGWLALEGAGRIDLDGLPASVDASWRAGPFEPGRFTVSAVGTPPGGTDLRYVRTEGPVRVDVVADDLTSLDFAFDSAGPEVSARAQFLATGRFLLDARGDGRDGTEAWRAYAQLPEVRALELDLGLGPDVAIRTLRHDAPDVAASLLDLHFAHVGTLQFNGVPRDVWGFVDVEGGSMRALSLHASEAFPFIAWTGVSGSDNEIRHLQLRQATGAAVRVVAGGTHLDAITFTPGAGSITGDIVTTGSYDSGGWNRYRTTFTGDGLTRLEFHKLAVERELELKVSERVGAGLVVHHVATSSRSVLPDDFRLDVVRPSAGEYRVTLNGFYRDVAPGGCVEVDVGAWLPSAYRICALRDAA